MKAPFCAKIRRITDLRISRLVWCRRRFCSSPSLFHGVSAASLAAFRTPVSLHFANGHVCHLLINWGGLTLARSGSASASGEPLLIHRATGLTSQSTSVQGAAAIEALSLPAFPKEEKRRKKEIELPFISNPSTRLSSQPRCKWIIPYLSSQMIHICVWLRPFTKKRHFLAGVPNKNCEFFEMYDTRRIFQSGNSDIWANTQRRNMISTFNTQLRDLQKVGTGRRNVSCIIKA